MIANLANVLRDPIEGEAGLVRHNMKVLTDSLTDGEKQMMITKIQGAFSLTHRVMIDKK